MVRPPAGVARGSLNGVAARHLASLSPTVWPPSDVGPLRLNRAAARPRAPIISAHGRWTATEPPAAPRPFHTDARAALRAPPSPPRGAGLRVVARRYHRPAHRPTAGAHHH